ncbi:glycoside hydrolase family 79 protein [Durotheca rogersii]|uniref:glycoside hydrolase family 79 protein n=1 Tax=Durotheca rogersii TaxID=419775 RepID=UPI00221EFF8D|nr:glycoside hydrolase family 79 protein [Durotheca rogersii]KAI5864771.1 glycoside hydrolase family 79 protein [Durotheca rogersii]
MRGPTAMLAQAPLSLALARPVIFDVSSTAAAANASTPFDGFVSYSIEFSSFPDYAGNKSHPNTFSYALLANLGAVSGPGGAPLPCVRVGGNTQDYALFDPDLAVALNGTYDPARSPDYPTTLAVGPSFFESYAAWPAGVRFTHGFNLGGNHAPAARRRDTLLRTAALVCRALGGGGGAALHALEYGNEPDLFATSAQGPVRPLTYDEPAYVAEWLNGTRAIRDVFAEHCPDLLRDGELPFVAPSFAGTRNHLRAPQAWAAGLDADRNIKYFSSHNYISGADTPGVTLQGTLMNHTRTQLSVAAHAAEYASLGALSHPLPPLILGETNSLYNQGRRGLSDTFGAALWGVDFALAAAAAGVRRVYFHTGVGYRYAAWQPGAVRPPYYGHVAVAAFLGAPAGAASDAAGERAAVSVAALEPRRRPADPHADAAYAAYAPGGALARLLVLNLRAYNYTLGGGGGPELNPEPRPQRTYRFRVSAFPPPAPRAAAVRRLRANGSDAVAGLSWDRWSYESGRPRRLADATLRELVPVGPGGVLELRVPDSEAAVLDFLR